MLKKLISIFITTALSLSMLIFPAFAEDEPLTTNDALNVLKAAVGAAELTAAQKNRYDFDGNGKIEAADALIILKIIAGIVLLETEDNDLTGMWKFSHFILGGEPVTIEGFPAFFENEMRERYEVDKEYLELSLTNYKVKTIDELVEKRMKEELPATISVMKLYKDWSIDFKEDGKAVESADFGFGVISKEEAKYTIDKNIVRIDGVEAEMTYNPKTRELELPFRGFSIVYKKV